MYFISVLLLSAVAIPIRKNTIISTGNVAPNQIENLMISGNPGIVRGNTIVTNSGAIIRSNGTNISSFSTVTDQSPPAGTSTTTTSEALSTNQVMLADGATPTAATSRFSFSFEGNDRPNLIPRWIPDDEANIFE